MYGTIHIIKYTKVSSHITPMLIKDIPLEKQIMLKAKFLHYGETWQAIRMLILKQP